MSTSVCEAECVQLAVLVHGQMADWSAGAAVRQGSLAARRRVCLRNAHRLPTCSTSTIQEAHSTVGRLLRT